MWAIDICTSRILENIYTRKKLTSHHHLEIPKLSLQSANENISTSVGSFQGKSIAVNSFVFDASFGFGFRFEQSHSFKESIGTFVGYHAGTVLIFGSQESIQRIVIEVSQDAAKCG